MTKADNGRKTQYHIFPVLFMVFTVFIFAPVEMYAGISEDVWFSLFDFAGYLIVMFIIALIISVIADMILSRLIPYVWEVCLCVVSWIFISLYVQGNFLHFDYGFLDGNRIDWSLYKTQGLISAGLFIAFVLAGIILCLKLRSEEHLRLLRIISVCLLLIEAVTIIAVSAGGGLFDRKTQVVSTCEDEYTYSPRDNIIMIVLDRYDGRVMDDLLSGPEADYVKDVFKDFTYASDATSLYGMTDYSVSHMLTCGEYICDSPFMEYYAEGLKSSPLLTGLRERGYKTGIYTTMPLPDDPAAADNWAETEADVSSHRKLLGYIYRFVGFRYMPQQLKELFWFYPDDMNSLKTVRYAEQDRRMEDSDIYMWDNYIFDAETRTALYEVRDIPGAFKLYHLKGMHNVRDRGRDFEPAEPEVPENETALGLTDMLGRYFTRLKEIGVYDNSSIIILADHGDSSHADDDIGNLTFFMYKSAGTRHSVMETDASPFTYRDLGLMYEMMLNGEELKLPVSDDRYIYRIVWTDHYTDALNHVRGFRKLYIDGPSDIPDSYIYRDEEYLIE